MFSDDVRHELAAITPRRTHDRLAELSGLFHFAGSIHLRGRGDVSVHLDFGSIAVARRAFGLLRSFDVSSEIRTYRQRAFDRAARYQLHVDGSDRARQVLHEAGVLSAGAAPLERPPRRLVARPSARAAYVRGALLAGGSVSAPPSAHIELRSVGRSGAEFLAGLARTEEIDLRVVERGASFVVYGKGIDTVAGLLALAGADAAVLALEERAVVAATRSRANRLANADHANLVRVSRASYAQLQAVRYLERSGAIEQLTPPLREIAELRVRNPTLSLRELGLKCRPPLPKASVHRRLKRLLELARR